MPPVISILLSIFVSSSGSGDIITPSFICTLYHKNDDKKALIELFLIKTI